MKKHFYTHLVEIDSIHTELEKLPIHSDEKDELLTLIHETIHHVVVDVILTELPKSNHNQFITLITHDQPEEVWTLISSEITDPEKKIRAAVSAFVKELHLDIEDLKKDEDSK